MTPAFLAPVLEASLKRAFICCSAGLADNGVMSDLRALALFAALLLALPHAAHADGDHERARAALQAGEVLPLTTVLERLQRSHPGQVLEVELEREKGRWIYEIKLLQADGHLLKLEVDARSAEVLRLRGRGAQALPPPPERP